MTTENLTVAPSRAIFGQILNDREYRTRSGAMQTEGQTGNRWSLTLTFNNVEGLARQSALMGHLFQLRGRRNRLGVPITSVLGYNRRGTDMSGTLTLHGNHNAGDVQLSVWHTNAGAQNNFLRAGDYIQIGNELKIVTQDVDLIGGPAPDGTINIWPELHQNYSGGLALEDDDPTGVFFLAQPLQVPIAPHVNSDWLNPSITVQLEEDVLA